MKITKTTKQQQQEQIRRSIPSEEELNTVFKQLEALEVNYGEILPIGEKQHHKAPKQARSTEINWEEGI